MRLRTLAVFLWCLLIAGATLASEQHRAEIRIEIDGDDSEHSVFMFDSQDSGIDLDKLAVGESKTYKDGDGNDVTVTRNKDGFEFEVSGEKTVVADVLHDEHKLKVQHLAHDDADVVVKKHRKIHVVDTDVDVGVTIISGDEIDSDTRQRIEQVLKEAGHSEEILFMDGSESPGNENVTN